MAVTFRDGSPWSSKQTEKINDLIKIYAPYVYFHEAELYFPTSVEWFLRSSILVDSDGNVVKETINEQENLGNDENKYYSNHNLVLKNTNPGDINDWKNKIYEGMLGDDKMANAPMYATIEVDDYTLTIIYHFFYAYSGPQTGQYFGEFFTPHTAEHQGDWEAFAVRLNQNCSEVLAYGYSAHGDITWIKERVEIEDSTHATVYSSLFTHGNYPFASRYVLKRISVPVPPFGHINFGDLTYNKGITKKEDRSRWVPSEYIYIDYEDKNNIKKFPWAYYQGRWGAHVEFKIEAFRRLGNGIFTGVYNRSPNSEQRAVVAEAIVLVPIFTAIAGLGLVTGAAATGVGGAVTKDIKIIDSNGPQTPWYSGVYKKFLGSIYKITTHTGQGSNDGSDASMQIRMFEPPGNLIGQLLTSRRRDRGEVVDYLEIRDNDISPLPSVIEVFGGHHDFWRCSKIVIERAGGSSTAEFNFNQSFRGNKTGWITRHKSTINTIALKANNGQFVTAEGGGGKELLANRDIIGSWETFELIDLSNSRIALKANNGQFVTAEGGGGKELLANRDIIGSWETFEAHRNTIKRDFVYIYEDVNFDGKSAELLPGDYDMSSLGIPNDSLSSLKVPLGMKVTLYEHHGFAGRSKTFTHDTPRVDDFNDITSSIKVEGIPIRLMSMWGVGTNGNLGKANANGTGWDDAGVIGGWTLKMIAFDQQGLMWGVGTEGNLLKANGTGWDNAGVIGGWTLKMIAFDQQGLMWGVGTEGNLGKANGTGWDDLGFPGGWTLKMIAFDQQGLMWGVGTEGNLGKANGTGWDDLGFLGGWTLKMIAFDQQGQM
ncbi:MAG: Vps62-related protein [Calothrix sp. MO_192.B10]|nr:Vps62-related protein [Calothrix sp. MO_192.B10]